jgi:hypothetical protein
MRATLALTYLTVFLRLATAAFVSATEKLSRTLLLYRTPTK